MIVTWPGRCTKATGRMHPAWPRLTASMIRRRSQRSAATPATGPMTSAGRLSAMKVIPVASAEPVSSKTW